MSASGEAGAESGPLGAVEVGGYLLEVGGAGGTLAKPVAAAREGDLALERAIEQDESTGVEGAAAAAAAIDDASEVTAQVERAVALGRGAAAGKALDPEQLALEAGVLLDLLDRLDREGRFEDALRLARALVNLLTLLRRWAELLRALRAALRAGEKLGDLSAIAWAKHELGTLRLAAGDVKGAERCLGEAREIRGRIGDRPGLAATNRNMQGLCERLREMLRAEQLVRRSDGRSATRLLALAALFVLLFGGGMAAGMIAADSNDSNGSGGSGGVGTGGDGSSGPTGQDGNETIFYTLRVIPAGEGGGTVTGGPIACPPVCDGELPDGEGVTLEAIADEKSIFEGFVGEGCGGSGPCRLTMDDDETVTATFGLAGEEPPPEEGGEEGGGAEGGGAEEGGDEEEGAPEEGPPPPPSEEIG